MAKKTAADSSTSEGPKVSVMAMVRQALAQHGSDAKPAVIRDFILEKFNESVPTGQISSYKTLIKKKEEKSTDTATPKASSPKGVDNSLVVELISSVRTFQNKMGTKMVFDIVSALSNESK